jgi:transcriptional regulator with XRE-family HTH domain
VKLTNKQGAILRQLGLNIKRARLRRKQTMEAVSTAAGISVPTLRSIEKGDPNTSMGAYFLALFILGLEKDLARVAYKDDLGQQIMDAELGVRVKRK